MRKFYLFMMTLLVQLITVGSVFAEDPPKSEYDAAMAAIQEGDCYIITTINGKKYSLDADGYLVEFDGDYETATKFNVTKKSHNDGLYGTGLRIAVSGTAKCFSNPVNGSYENDSITDTHLNQNASDRDQWEVQVPYLKKGKYAIRACNVAYAASGWAHVGSSFWTYIIDPADEDQIPMATYSFTPQYIWEFDLGPMRGQVQTAIDAIYNKYEEIVWDDPGEESWGFPVNLGQEVGQCTDGDTYKKLWDMLQLVSELSSKFLDDEYDYYNDPQALTLDDVAALSRTVDSLYQVVLNSEKQYMPEDGYYRIIAFNPYKSTFDESGFVSKAICASFMKENKDKVCFSTLDRGKANFVWKFTKSESGDSILMQNLGMETYIKDATIQTTADLSEASYVQFDYAYARSAEDLGMGNRNFERGPQAVELPNGEEVERDIINIRLAKEPRHNNYFHQNGHSSVVDEGALWGNYGFDTGKEQPMGTWMRTWDWVDGNGNSRGVDMNTSEWYLEPVPAEEIEQLVADFAIIKDHDLLVVQNKELREKVAETIRVAKDVIKENWIASAEQLSSPYSDSAEGTNIGALIDNNPDSFWHTDWHNQAPAGMYYNYDGVDIECHYLQISGMDNRSGECTMYFRERDADDDRPKTIVIMGTDNLKNADEDWEEIVAPFDLEHTGKKEENFVSLTIDEPYPYWRILVLDTDHNSNAFRKFWHAAEIQFFTEHDNPNSQFVQLGDVAENLETELAANLLISDEELTLENYEALLNAYNTFLTSGLVDPAKMRNALATFAKTTEGVKEGTQPGQWSDTQAAQDFDALYAEFDAYEKAGKWNEDEIEEYILTLQAMKKRINEGANGIKTDKWYRIMVPTEEMFTEYNFSTDPADKTSLREDQATMFGTFATAGVELSEDVPAPTDENPEATKKENHLEAYAAEDVREGETRLYYMAEDEIADKDVSMFRFIEFEPDQTDTTPLALDVLDNMYNALELATIGNYEIIDSLITDAAQYSSNASYPGGGNDGQKLADGILFDNNTATYWHSDYSRTICEVPYLQVALNEPVSGLIQVYIARRNTNNGHVTRMFVQGSNDAQTWENVGYIVTPFTDVNTPVYSLPINLPKAYSYLRFTMTCRYGTDGGSNIEFDPLAEGLTANDYNTKFTYFHVAEFQIYTVAAKTQVKRPVQDLQLAYSNINSIVVKDINADELSAAKTAYRAFREDFNASKGKDILPYGMDNMPSSYALQNKATGLFLHAAGGNTNDMFLRTIPTLFTYSPIGYERSLLHGTNVDGTNCTNLHAGESNRRVCTWGSTEPTSGSALVLREAEDDFEVPAQFTYQRTIWPGAINGIVSTVEVTPETIDDAAIFSPVGMYTEEDEGIFLAVKEIDKIPAGEPVIYIYNYNDTTKYKDLADDEFEAVKFTMAGEPEFVLKADTINGLIGFFGNNKLAPRQIYFKGNYAQSAVSGKEPNSGFGGVAVDYDICPEIDPEAVDFDFSILIAAADVVDGVENVPAAIEKISQRGNVYSIDGKLLRKDANLNSLKTMGKGIYILNGVKVYVK